MVEDEQHLTIFDEITKELQENLVRYNQKANGESDKQKLIELRLEQNDVLVDLLKKHRRVMLYMAGKPIDPEMHFGESVLLPVGGL
jgi:hypothetical protein